ncbi:Arginine metabolism regulation protein II like [Verticillium longisporum]|nr:Arginine metabolism regulation protein II like [Verticillium longisporum]
MGSPHTSKCPTTLPVQGLRPVATQDPTHPEKHLELKRPRRRKTFTGCWTCRDRHVKCDEQRPHCRRCTVGGFTCHGYGVRLAWVTQPGKLPSSTPSAPPQQHIRQY